METADGHCNSALPQTGVAKSMDDCSNFADQRHVRRYFQGSFGTSRTVNVAFGGASGVYAHQFYAKWHRTIFAATVYSAVAGKIKPQRLRGARSLGGAADGGGPFARIVPTAPSPRRAGAEGACVESTRYSSDHSWASCK